MKTPTLLRLACLALLPLAAQAELSNDSMIGPGLRWRPAYDGAASQKTELVPVIRYLGLPWFVRSTQGVLEAGVRTELGTGLHAGAQIAYEPGRLSGDSDFLRSHNMPDLKRSGSLGLQVEWDHKFGPVPVTLLARGRKHFDSARGLQMDLRASAGVFQSGPVSAGVFGQAVWANGRATNSYYGITPTQSVVAGLPAYEAGSGLLNTSFGLLWSVDLGPKWLVVGNLERRQVRGDARNSPLVERTSNNSASAGLAYRF